MSSTVRTARRLVGTASLAAAIALLAPTAASANDVLGGGARSGVEEAVDVAEEPVTDVATTITSSDRAADGSSDGEQPLDAVLDPVEDAVDEATDVVSGLTDPAPEPVESGADTVAETADGAADQATATVRSVVGVPDDDAPADDGAPAPPAGPAPTVRDDAPQQGAATGPTRRAPLLSPVREGLPVYGGSRTYLPGLAVTAPQVAPADIIADPLARTAVAAPQLAPPTLASAPTAPIEGLPDLPGGIATEIVVAAALLVLATGSLAYELGPERARA